MSTTSTNFTGSSYFSANLQSIITNAVALANLPITQLNNTVTTLNSEASDIGTLSTKLTAVQSALTALDTASSQGSLSATVSDTSILTATAASTTLPGTYTVDVLDPGSVASALSKVGSTAITDPSTQNISSSKNFSLTVNGKSFTVASSSNLNALAQNINASGAGVQATILNLGSTTSPSYRLAIQGSSVGAETIQLNDGSSDLLSSLAGGSNASYTVNGEPPGGISAASRTVTVAPGLTVNLETAGSASVLVGNNSSAITNALTSLVSAYNSVKTQLDTYHGQNAGVLAGNSLVSTVQIALHSALDYSGAGGSGVNSLSDLGVSFDKTGQLQFDPTALSSFTPDQISQARTFLGSATTGGFLQAATNELSSLTDPTTGALATEVNSITTQVTHNQNLISADQDKVSIMQTNLTAKMAAADALISSLEQQTSYFTALFNYGQNNGNGSNG